MRVGDKVKIEDKLYERHKEYIRSRGFPNNIFTVTSVYGNLVNTNFCNGWKIADIELIDPLNTVKLTDEEKSILKELNNENRR